MGLVFLISNFFITKTSLANDEEKIPYCSNLALLPFVSWIYNNPQKMALQPSHGFIFVKTVDLKHDIGIQDWGTMSGHKRVENCFFLPHLTKQALQTLTPESWLIRPL